MFERIYLAPGTTSCLDTERETWLFELNGDAVAGSLAVARRHAKFALVDRVHICTGTVGIVDLVAYPAAGPVRNLLQRLGQPDTPDARSRHGVCVLYSLAPARAV